MKIKTFIAVLLSFVLLACGCLNGTPKPGSGDSHEDDILDTDFMVEKNENTLSALIKEIDGHCEKSFFDCVKRLEGFNSEGYSVESTNYMENGNGRQTLNVYWHKSDCDQCNYGDCTKFRLYLFYVPQGVDVKAATPGYEKYNSEKVFTKLIDNNKTSFVVLISDKIFVRFNVNDGCKNHDQIIQDLIGLYT